MRNEIRMSSIRKKLSNLIIQYLCVVMKSRKRQRGTDIAELSSVETEVARSLKEVVTLLFWN